MLRGRAVGGPRNGAILEAGQFWLGKIKDHLDGRYRWNAEDGTWQWGTSTDPLDSELFADGSIPDVRDDGGDVRRKNARQVRENATIFVDGARRVVTGKSVLPSGNIELTLDDGTVIRRAPGAKVEMA